jgi:ABC-type Fe3+-hydroxamate transport system substrate-binding protein
VRILSKPNTSKGLGFLFLTSPSSSVAMQASFTDPLGTTIQVQFPPKRIISLVPSQTELLFSLGLEEEVIGITKFCVHPPHWRNTKAIVGGTKNFHFDVIDSLQPDLIIGNKEENYEDGIVTLREKYAVWMSDIVSLEDSLSTIYSLGQLVNKQEKANRLMDAIRYEFATLKISRSLKALYLIWRNPWMAAGQNTFIDSMLQVNGWQNVMNRERYPRLTDQELEELNPDVVFLSSEPYPFKNKHINELQKHFPKAKIMLVDGEMFSWYGSRLLLAPRYFRSLLEGF